MTVRIQFLAQVTMLEGFDGPYRAFAQRRAGARQIASVPLGSIVLTLLYGDAAAEDDERNTTRPLHIDAGMAPRP